MMRQTGLTYDRAGVSIPNGNRFAAMVKELVAEAWPEMADEIGGFAGGGQIPAGATMVKGCCDGGGTKPKVAALMNDVRGVGQCALAMSAVDAYAAGAYPTYAVDTISVGELYPELHIGIVEGVIDGCKLAGCKLIGGETAELPGMFKYPWLFLVDTAVIAFPAPELAYVPVKAGQPVFGWLSHGPAANGLSLIRRVFELDGLTPLRRFFHRDGIPTLARRRLEKRWPELGGQTLAEAILSPTPIYIRPAEAQRQQGVKYAGHAHITGGGLVENIPRILPPHLKVRLECGNWYRPGIFPLIQRVGNVPDADMNRTFNQGIMMVSIVSNESTDRPFDANEVGADLVRHIGEVVPREGNEPQVEFTEFFNDMG